MYRLRHWLGAFSLTGRARLAEFTRIVLVGCRWYRGAGLIAGAALLASFAYRLFSSEPRRASD
mgnify:CR=1 FL=1